MNQPPPGECAQGQHCAWPRTTRRHHLPARLPQARSPPASLPSLAPSRDPERACRQQRQRLGPRRASSSMSGFKKDEEGFGGVGSFFQDKTVRPACTRRCACGQHRAGKPATPSRARELTHAPNAPPDRDPGGEGVQRDADQPSEMSHPAHQDRVPPLRRRDLWHPGSHDPLLWRHEALPAQGCELAYLKRARYAVERSGARWKAGGCGLGGSGRRSGTADHVDFGATSTRRRVARSGADTPRRKQDGTLTPSRR